MLDERALKACKKFGWRGYSIINFCPGCMKPLLTANEAEAFRKAFEKADLEACEAAIVHAASGFGVYIPGDEETAQLLNHRVVVHPFCFDCSTRVGETEFEEGVERNIVLSRRFIALRRIKT